MERIEKSLSKRLTGKTDKKRTCLDASPEPGLADQADEVAGDGEDDDQDHNQRQDGHPRGPASNVVVGHGHLGMIFDRLIIHGSKTCLDREDAAWEIDKGITLGKHQHCEVLVLVPVILSPGDDDVSFCCC